MNVHGYELIEDWKSSNVGFTALAKKGGKKFFLKRYGEYKMPRKDSSTSPTLYARLEKSFNEFKNYRIAINTSLKEIAVMGGNIILPNDWWVEDINFIEATEFINGILSDDAINALSQENLEFIMKTAAGALISIHKKNIVHSDLKRSNIIVVKNTMGREVAKIIDFDKSYFVGKVREDDLGGDQVYMSPELALCIMQECEEGTDTLTTKSDVFSLGMVFYSYLTGGGQPEIVELKGKLKERRDSGKAVCCCEALLGGAKLSIGKEIKEEYLRRLIANMLYKDPEKRISAQRVLDVLKSKEELDVLDGQGIAVEIEKKIPKTFCELWPEHAGTINEAVCRARGFVGSQRKVVRGNNAYEFFKADGTSQSYIYNNLKLLGLVTSSVAAPKPAPAPAPAPTPKPEPAPAPTPARDEDEEKPWPEDVGYELLQDKAKADGYVKIIRFERNGKKLYAIVKADGNKIVAPISNIKLMGYAKKL